MIQEALRMRQSKRTSQRAAAEVTLGRLTSISGAKASAMELKIEN
jgi:hypothetical protein